jgi:hypothetical protein
VLITVQHEQTIAQKDADRVSRHTPSEAAGRRHEHESVRVGSGENDGIEAGEGDAEYAARVAMERRQGCQCAAVAQERSEGLARGTI